jgi:hypothetical protein
LITSGFEGPVLLSWPMWIERNALHLPSHRANTPRARVIYLGDQQYAKLEFAKDGYRFVAVLFRAWFEIALVSLIHWTFVKFSSSLGNLLSNIPTLVTT